MEVALGDEWRANAFSAVFGQPSGPIGWVGARVLPFVVQRLYEVMADALDLQADDDLLDVGCGSAVFLDEQAAHVRYVAGLDASQIQVGLARRRLRQRIAAGTARDRPGRCRGTAVAGRPVQCRHEPELPEVRPRP